MNSKNVQINSEARKNEKPFNFIETIERLQLTSGINEEEWLDILRCTWRSYFNFRSGLEKLPLSSIESLANYLHVEVSDLIRGNLDFNDIALRNKSFQEIPDYYMVAAYGRLRTTITSLEFLEKKFGWRLKNDILRHFSISETILKDAFAPVSIRLITDICQYLHMRRFCASDFFNMGAYSFEGNKGSIVGHLYSEMSDFREAFDAFATSIMPMFEHNCTYTFKMRDALTGLVDVKSNPDIAATLDVNALGSPHICQLKAGIWASLTSYFGISLPRVTHTLCEHKGDHVCRFVFDFSGCHSVASSALNRANFLN